jgi:hypothetical protein
MVAAAMQPTSFMIDEDRMATTIAGNRRRLGAALVLKGPLEGHSNCTRDLTLSDGLSSTQHSQQAIEQFLGGPVVHHFLHTLDLLVKRGKEASPAQILAEGTQAGTSSR